MEPLNTQERRAHFFRFLLLFLFAVTPVVIVTYLYGRVDHVENTYLRSTYEGNRSSSEAAAGKARKLADVINKAGDLTTLVTESSGDMLKFHLGTNRSGEIEGKLEKFKEATEDLNRELGSPPDSVMLQFVALSRNYAQSCKQFNSAYRQACDDLGKAANDLAGCTSQSAKYRSAMQKANAKLPQEQKEDPNLQ